MEFVYVIPRTELFPERALHGLELFGDGYPSRTFADRVRAGGFFCERDYAERTPTLKQVIPYCLVHVEEKILLTRRLPKGGESRLFGKLSIGIGGHINPEDLENEAATDPILAGTRRELAEELEIRGDIDIRPLGLLNDDTNSVGAVHVGVVQLVTVRGSVSIREQDILEGRLVSPGELKELHAGDANFETWSSLLVESLDEFLPEPIPVVG